VSGDACLISTVSLGNPDTKEAGIDQVIDCFVRKSPGDIYVACALSEGRYQFGSALNQLGGLAR
jgi:hypothetical protein